MMTNTQVRLVQQSWKIFQQMDPILIGSTFYSKLFAEHPQLKKLFPRAMEAQSVKLVDMLTSIVTRLERPSVARTQIEAMGVRHRQYGVKPAHYQMVGEALLWTLQAAYGNAWHQDLQEAWEACYRDIAMLMCPEAESKIVVSDTSCS